MRFLGFFFCITTLLFAKMGDFKTIQSDFVQKVTNDQNIEKISYKDKLENNVEILFSNQSINLFLDDELFKAEIPKGYDIVRE